MTTRQEAQARYPKLQQIIGGGVEEGTGPEVAVIDPTTEQVLGHYNEVSTDALDRALTMAADGFRVWKTTSPVQRGAILNKIADTMRARAPELAELVVLELGKPMAEAVGEVEQAAGMWQWAAEEGRRAYGRIIPSREAGTRQMVLREPLGPVAAFGSWNAPLITPSRKISGALGAGCSMIIKASEEVPACTLALAKIAYECGLPEGVLSVVIGDPATISERLIDSPVTRGVTFTGSTKIGQILAARAVSQGKRPIMELGGHAPVLIFDGVDVEKTARAAAISKFRNSGQICVAPTRFFVQRPIHDAFAEALAAAANDLKLGCGFDASSTMGPLIDKRRVAAMEAFLEDAQKRSLNILAGGVAPNQTGYFFEPTVIAGAPSDAMVQNIEPFGPIAATAPFDTYDEAIALANRLPFALAAFIQSENVHTATRAIDDVEAGNVICNGWRVSLPETPFGGIKQSGLFAEGGIEGLEAFQTVKSAFLA